MQYKTFKEIISFDPCNNTCNNVSWKESFLLIYILTNAVNGGSVRIRAPMYTGSVEGVTTSTTFRWTSMDTSNRIPRCITTYAFKIDTCTPTKNKLFCFHPIFKSNFFMKTKNANKAMYN